MEDSKLESEHNKIVKQGFEHLAGNRIAACFIKNIDAGNIHSIDNLVEVVNQCENRELVREEIDNTIRDLDAYGLVKRYSNGRFDLTEAGHEIRESEDFIKVHP